MSDYYATALEKRDRLLGRKEAIVLAIETSCDETAAAVVKNGREVMSNIVHSQIPVHRRYGGVVPEIASRNHVEKLPETVAAALEEANVSFCELDAIAVTARPGLVGALLTGVSYAKGLAYALTLPLIGVHHILGHIAANYISHPALTPPFTCLVASGGHSHIFFVESYNRLSLIGHTRDDAAGEAFDKVARVLGLPYPGGPELEKLAKEGNPDVYTFPGGFNAQAGFDFSFSGLKTAVINLLHTAAQRGEMLHKADVAASFQKNIVDVLVHKSVLAAKERGGNVLALCGGVSANRALTESFQLAAKANGLTFLSPEWKYCGDNAAMIGCAGYYALMDGQMDGLDLNAAARATY